MEVFVIVEKQGGFPQKVPEKNRSGIVRALFAMGCSKTMWIKKIIV
jgi:hypothetical protein